MKQDSIFKFYFYFAFIIYCYNSCEGFVDYLASLFNLSFDIIAIVTLLVICFLSISEWNRRFTRQI